MTPASRTFLGALLISGVVIFPALGGIFAYFQPRYYFSRATVELRSPSISSIGSHFSYRGAEDFSTPDPKSGYEGSLRWQHLLRSAMVPNGSQEELKFVRQTDLVDVVTWDRDSTTAADMANAAAKRLFDADAAELKSFKDSPKIWQKAVPATFPTVIHLWWYIAFGVALGAPLLTSGVLLLIRRDRHLPLQRSLVP